MDVTIGGKRFHLTKEQVLEKMHGKDPESLKTYRVKLHGRDYPCKQVLATVTGLPRAKLNAHHAYRVLERLGLPVAARS